MKILPVLAVAMATTLHAQELAPELAPIVAKHHADVTALDAQKSAATKRAQQTYVGALDSAEKTETTAGRLAAVSAITLERRNLTRGELPESPRDLPKGLLTARKSYLDSVARANADFGKRFELIAADYLRALAVLQQQAGRNAPLSKQIVDEKERLLQTRTHLARMNVGVVGTWDLRNLGNNSTMKYEFKPDGTFVEDSGKRLGTWELKGKHVVSSWETQAGLSDQFDLPVREGKLTGKNNKGPSLLLTRNRVI